MFNPELPTTARPLRLTVWPRSLGLPCGRPRSLADSLEVTEVGGTGAGAGSAPPLWATGMVTSNATTFIPYAGPALTPDTDYSVSLKAADGSSVRAASL